MEGVSGGFFDGDEDAMFPSFANADLELLEGVKSLLNEFGIRTARYCLR